MINVSKVHGSQLENSKVENFDDFGYIKWSFESSALIMQGF